MEGFCYCISGKPHYIQKIFNRLKDSLSDLSYKSDSYLRTTLLPRGSSEIEVLDKKGYIVSFVGKGFSVYSNFSTNFLRKSGLTIGHNSRLKININSKDPSKLVDLASEISDLNPLFEEKGNYSFAED